MQRSQLRRIGQGPRDAFKIAAVLLLLLSPLAPSQAEPIGNFLTLNGPTHGYLEVPHDAGLNPVSAFTFEAWLRMEDAHGGTCSSIAGKNFQQSWWIGICGTTLRSYLQGAASSRSGGTIPTGGEWTHIAVVYDGSERRHYINGELAARFADSGTLPASSAPLRFGSDVEFERTPSGSIDEARLWNVARTEAEIRAGLAGISAPFPAGLVALWNFASESESAGGRLGTLHGTANFGGFAPSGSCDAAGAEPDTLCLFHRFRVRASFRVGAVGTSRGTALKVATPNPGSGLFYFFNPDNWEVMVKAIDGCGLNNRHWIFSAATTNVFYRLEVFDVLRGRLRIYLNYPGPPAPAVTDTEAFATCP